MTRRALIEELVQWVGENLPDSISKRRRLLDACLIILPERSPVRRPIGEMKLHLDAHDAAQAELPLVWRTETDNQS
jgi:hypothetical protein